MNRPKRVLAHIIDTKAVRRLISALSEDWVVRDLSERDYGIDLKLEYFDGELPTGIIVFLQVKGTSKNIKPQKDIVTCGKFPIHTLNYSSLFPEAFFLVYLSIEEKKPIYFLWLQKYILYEQGKLFKSKGGQKTVSLKIPSSNNLCTEEGKKKFKDISKSNSIAISTLNFLKDCMAWKRLYEDFLKDKSNRQDLIECIKKLQLYDGLYTHLFSGHQQPIINFSERISDINLIVDFDDDEDRIKKLDEFGSDLEIYAKMLLGEEIVEDFIVESTNKKPY